MFVLKSKEARGCVEMQARLSVFVFGPCVCPGNRGTNRVGSLHDAPLEADRAQRIVPRFVRGF